MKCLIPAAAAEMCTSSGQKVHRNGANLLITDIILLRALLQIIDNLKVDLFAMTMLSSMYR